jgi:hypothetical protein
MGKILQLNLGLSYNQTGGENNDIGMNQPHLSVRDKVNALESEMKKQTQVTLEVKHHFSYGIYARELFIPKGVMLTGKIHKYEQFNILSKGSISVLIDDKMQRISAPFTVVSKAGTKRIALAHTDCIWITVHGTHERNLEKIEEYFIAQNEQEYLEFCGQMKLLEDLREVKEEIWR